MKNLFLFSIQPSTSFLYQEWRRLQELYHQKNGNIIDGKKHHTNLPQDRIKELRREQEKENIKRLNDPMPYRLNHINSMMSSWSKEKNFDDRIPNFDSIPQNLSIIKDSDVDFETKKAIVDILTMLVREEQCVNKIEEVVQKLSNDLLIKTQKIINLWKL